MPLLWSFVHVVHDSVHIPKRIQAPTQLATEQHHLLYKFTTYAQQYIAHHQLQLPTTERLEALDRKHAAAGNPECAVRPTPLV